MKDIFPVKILHVKINPADQATEYILRELEYDIISAAKEEDALSILANEDGISVIVFECSGNEKKCLNMVLNIYNHSAFSGLPFIFITNDSYSYIEEIKKNINSPVDFLQIPLNPEVLGIKINAMHNLYNANRQFILQERALTQLRQDLEVQKAEKQKAEEELRLRNLQLSEALSLTHLGSWDWNISTNKVKCSDEIYNIFDIDKNLDDFSMEVLLDKVHPADVDKVRTELKSSIDNKTSFDLYFRHVSPDNEVRLINNKGKIVTNTDNEVQKIFGTSQDITELKKTEQQLKVFNLMEKMLNEIFIFSWMDFTLLYANADALRSLGMTINELKGKHLYDLLSGYNKASFKKIISPLLKGKKDKVIFFGEFCRKDDSTYPVEIHVQLIEQDERKIFLAVVLDLTERRRSEKELAASLKEKDILLKEIHHRVKNNLQIIYSLLNLQSGNVNDEKILNIFRESQNRIKSMALIHEKLYKHNLSMIDFSEYLDDLVSSLIFSYRVNTSKVDVRINTPRVYLNIDIAISLGLCVTELVSNSFKYAFPPNEQGLVKVVLEINNNILSLCVMDTGGKLPAGFDIEASDSLGLKLVASLAEQHHGSLRIEAGKTTSFIIDIPLKDDAQIHPQNDEESSRYYRETAAG